MYLRAVAIIFALCSISAEALSASFNDAYQEALKGFECAMLASAGEDDHQVKEMGRLLGYGYDHAIAGIPWLKEGSGLADDQGPYAAFFSDKNDDLFVGMFFQIAGERVSSLLANNTAKYDFEKNTIEARKIAAKEEFNKRECKRLGK